MDSPATPRPLDAERRRIAARHYGLARRRILRLGRRRRWLRPWVHDVAIDRVMGEAAREDAGSFKSENRIRFKLNPKRLYVDAIRRRNTRANEARRRVILPATLGEKNVPAVEHPDFGLIDDRDAFEAILALVESDRDRELMRLKFGLGLDTYELMSIFGICESRVFQIVRSNLATLKAKLGDQHAAADPR